MPRSKPSLKGKIVVFYCKSDKHGDWTKEGEQLPPHSSTTFNFENTYIRLTLYNVQITDTGIYTCHGENNDFTYFQQSAYLVVVGKCSNMKHGSVEVAVICNQFC